MPALAIADALAKRGAVVSFAGSPERIESRLVPAAGYELDALETAPLPRRPGRGTLRSLALNLRAPLAARALLQRRRPDVVLGAGGYTGGPAVLAAAVERIPAAVTEADAHLGLANRLAAPFVRRVFLAYPIEGLREPKYRVVGRAVPAGSKAPPDQATSRARFDLPADGPVVLIAGGSQGARALNEAAVAAFADAGPAVLHLAGERDYPELSRHPLRDTYRLLAYTDEFGTALAACDLVVSRSGGSVWEVAAAGRPAVLVPYPHATADHQTKNARYFERGGGALLVPESELDLGAVVEELLRDPDRLARMGQAMLRLARPDAADVIAEELIELAAAGG